MTLAGGASPTTTQAVRNVTTTLVTGYLVLACVLNGGLMAFDEASFDHPRFVHLQVLLHTHLEIFGIVLLLAGLTKGIASFGNDDRAHLARMRVALAATTVCGLCWTVNAFSQATAIFQTGDWPGLSGVGLLAGLFILHTAERFIYYLEIRSNVY